MTNLLQQAANVLQTEMERSASETVSYRRVSGGLPFDVLAIVGRSIVDQDSGEGFILRIVARDFAIRQSALNNIQPARGDIITQTINGVSVVFLVEGGPGQPHFEETDGYGVAWRIHTKRDKVNKF
jgi:hypothetical protein